MDDLVGIVESDAKIANLLAVAVERARPGTPVVVLDDPAALQRLTAHATQAPGRLPTLVLLGPSAERNASDEEIDALRKVLGAGVPVLALAVKDHERPPLDGVVELPLEWKPLSVRVAALLEEWL